MFFFNLYFRYKLICVGIIKVILNLMFLYCVNFWEINLFIGIVLYIYIVCIVDCICKYVVNMII